MNRQHKHFPDEAPPSQHGMSPTERDLLMREQTARAEAEAANRRLSILQAISDTALAHLKLDELLTALLDRIREALQAENSAILLTSEDETELVAHVIRGPEEAVASTVHVPIGKGIAGNIAASRAPLIIDDLTQVEVVTPLLREQIRSLVGVPLLAEGRVIGVLHVDSVKPNRFTQSDADLLRLIGEPIAQAIDHARLYHAEQQARAEAHTRARQVAALFEQAASRDGASWT